MNKYVKILMEDLDIKVGEEFNIIDHSYNIIEYSYNPFYFDEEGNLIDKDGDVANSCVYYLMNGTVEIKDVKLTSSKIKMLESRNNLFVL